MADIIKKRYDYIDAVKGLSILCITLLHFESGIFPDWLNIWIGLFMITAFYFTSGWLTGIRNKILKPKELFKKRLRQIGKPYLWFTIIILFFDLLWFILGFYDIKIFLRDIYKTVVLAGIGTLWFLPVLVFSEIFFCWILNSKKRILLCIISLLISESLRYLYFVYWLPVSHINDVYRMIDAPLIQISRFLLAWQIILVGYLFGKYIAHKILHLNRIYIFFIGVFLTIFSLLLVLCPQFQIYYVSSLLSNFIPVLGFMLLFISGKHNIISHFFEFWGRNSLILMCTHYSIILVICQTFCEQIFNAPFNGMITIYLFIITVIIEYPIVWLFNNKLKFMLGR